MIWDLFVARLKPGAKKIKKDFQAKARRKKDQKMIFRLKPGAKKIKKRIFRLKSGAKKIKK